MARFDTGTDDARVRIRPQRRSRPRTKRRPDYSNRPLGRVVGIDRGRFTVVMADTGKEVQAVKAREIPRSAVVIGDLVRLTGDVSGRVDTLARIAHVEERRNALRRSLEEADEGRGEKIVVANVDLVVVVSAAANPTPRVGMVERALVAAREAGVPALVCMTKIDLASPEPFLESFKGFPLEALSVDALTGEGLPAVAERLQGRFSVLIGHSGVGKSTLINGLIPDADRAVGHVNVTTGKGRHTSTSAVAFELPGGGWLVDTPGVRSFGLAHTEAEHVLSVFPGLSQAATYCLPNCTHGNGEPSCALDLWAAGEGPFQEEEGDAEHRRDIVTRARVLLDGLATPPWLRSE